MNQFTPPGQQRPEDIRNMVTFVVLAICMWLAFDHFIMKPQLETLRTQQIQKQQAAKIDPQATNTPRVIRTVEEALKDSARITLDNGEISGSIPLQGVRLDDVKLIQHGRSKEDETPVTLFSPESTTEPYFAEISWISDDKSIAVPDKKTNWTTQAAELSKNGTVTLTWSNGQGLTFERVITLDDHAMFSITDTIKNTSDKNITLYPYALLTRQGIPADFKPGIVREGVMGYINNELTDVAYNAVAKKLPEKSVAAKQGWIGISDKYWLGALVPDQTTDKTFRFLHTPAKNANDKELFQVDIVGAAKTLNAGGSIASTMHIHSGAKNMRRLDAYEKELNLVHFDLAIDYGWFWFLTKPFYWLLTWLGSAIGNMGLAIIAVTIIIRGAVFPLANTSYRSFAKLKYVQPQMMEIKEKHGSDRARMQEELMKLYQKEKVNPMAGCLPIIAQIPIFFALYKVISLAVEMRHAPFFGWIQDLSAPDPTSIFNLFGLLPFGVPSALHIGVWPILMLLTMLIQKQLNPPPTDASQRIMMNIFPFFITYILASFASGLVVYWTFSAFLSIIQQMVIMKSMNVPIHIFEVVKSKRGNTSDDNEVIDVAAIDDAPKSKPELRAPKHKKKK